MKTLSYSLVAIGFALVLGGIVAIINFDQPSEALSSAWWMIVNGWHLIAVGIGIGIVRIFKLAKREAA
ncbi:MAG: hypothetical protein KF876_17245 [Nitrospira sp.]|nr:hypothetical protein [Nitrospira sp.]MDR4462728.1 hypothetical protein [Nitrospira sp.]